MSLDTYRTSDTVTINPSEYLTLGSWASNGRPNYLTTRDTTVDTTFLQRLINTLPEGVNQVQKMMIREQGHLY